jgi:hypothetical protein
MNSQVGLTALSSVISLIGLSYLFFWRYRQYRIDLFRQEMFALRDELFDEAESGLIDFDHPAYGVLRNTMNGFIEFGHRLTFWHAVSFRLMVQEEENDKEATFERAWNRASENLDKKTKERLIEYRKRMDLLAMKHVMYGTPEAHLILAPLAIFVIFLGLFVFLFSRGKRTISALDQLRKRFSTIDDAAFMNGAHPSAHV